MTRDERPRVILDCTVFARALINPKGPAGACVSHAQRGNYTLVISEYVLKESQELPSNLKANRGPTPSGSKPHHTHTDLKESEFSIQSAASIRR